MRKVAKSIKEIEEIAGVFFKKILKSKSKQEGALVAGLSGDLGTGKTAFVKAMARYLGVKDKVDSPTFMIMKKYNLKNKKYKFLFHIDAYRLKSEKELLHLGWEEIIDNKDHLVFIEWPENVKKVIPSHAKHILFSHHKNNSRILEIE